MDNAEVLFLTILPLSEGENKMKDELNRTYFTFLLPVLLGFIFIYAARAYNFIRIGPIHYAEILAPSIFILSIVLAIALPMFYRTIFAHKKREQKKVSEADFIKFERRLIYITMVTPYLALAAYALEFSRFYTTGAILMGLYAVYYFFPSKKRLALDRRIFRVNKSILHNHRYSIKSVPIKKGGS
jgi:hypothetical protein